MNLIHKIFHWYFNKRSLPYWGIIIIDWLILLFAYLIVYFLFRPLVLHRFMIGQAPFFWSLLGWVSLRILVLSLFYLLGMRIFKTYRGIIRYSSTMDLLRIIEAMGVGGILTWIAHYIGFKVFQIHILGKIYFQSNIRTRDIIAATVLATFLMWLMRMLVKTVYNTTVNSEKSKKTVIYGVSDVGIALAKAMLAEKPQKFALKAFITDDKQFVNNELLGKRVYILNDDLIDHLVNRGIEVFMVSPLRAKDFRKNEDLQNKLIAAGIRIYMLSLNKDWKEGDTIDNFREVQVEDLLPRDEIQVDMDAVGNMLKGHRVLITGSAGSIGSEIVRQVAAFAPSQMILIDQAETPQHDLRLYMKKNYPHLPAETIVTSICRQDRMEEIFKTYHPEYVFHAAAYKHVPMMEDNPSEAVLNNVLGTQIIADLSVKFGVNKFVMISTDKAVNPTNVMGCSKRICEIYVQSLDKAEKEGKIKGHTKFVTTRFGNVLGSNGSVIPLFREQIKEGGPVTVTHPDIIRFFMLISEACQLVLEAGTHGEGGEIFVFDMGKPVKIVDLAKRMIELSGATNVQIEFTGLRDGEKLYEEVLEYNEMNKPSFHEKINIAIVRDYDYQVAVNEIKELIDISRNFDDMETVKMMKYIVPEYKSKHSKYEILDQQA